MLQVAISYSIGRGEVRLTVTLTMMHEMTAPACADYAAT